VAGAHRAPAGRAARGAPSAARSRPCASACGEPCVGAGGWRGASAVSGSAPSGPHSAAICACARRPLPFKGRLRLPREQHARSCCLCILIRALCAASLAGLRRRAGLARPACAAARAERARCAAGGAAAGRAGACAQPHAGRLLHRARDPGRGGRGHGQPGGRSRGLHARRELCRRAPAALRGGCLRVPPPCAAGAARLARAARPGAGPRRRAARAGARAGARHIFARTSLAAGPMHTGRVQQQREEEGGEHRV